MAAASTRSCTPGEVRAAVEVKVGVLTAASIGRRARGTVSGNRRQMNRPRKRLQEAKDRCVKLELSPYDLSRGRIVYRVK